MKRYIEIKRWDNQQVIHSGDFNSTKECLEDGVKKGISFYRADLGEPYLTVATLSREDLSRTNLRVADLKGGNLLLAKSISGGTNLRVADLKGLYS